MPGTRVGPIGAGDAPRAAAGSRAHPDGARAQDTPPIFGMIARGGQVRIVLLENVPPPTIRPRIAATIQPGTVVNTDASVIDEALPRWGYVRQRVCHSRGEDARDEDGDGVHEVPVNPMAGFWALLRSWLRPHRGISQEKLPLYLRCFEFVHHVRRRGRAWLGSLLDT